MQIDKSKAIDIIKEYGDVEQVVRTYLEMKKKIFDEEELGNPEGILSAIEQSIDQIETALSIYEDTESVDNIFPLSYFLVDPNGQFSGFNKRRWDWVGKEENSEEHAILILERDLRVLYIGHAVIKTIQFLINKDNRSELINIIIEKLSMPDYMVEYHVFSSYPYGGPALRKDINKAIDSVEKESEVYRGLKDFYEKAIRLFIQEPDRTGRSFAIDLSKRARRTNDILASLTYIAHSYNMSPRNRVFEVRLVKGYLCRIPLAEFAHFVVHGDFMSENPSEDFIIDINKIKDLLGIDNIARERIRLRINHDDKIKMDRIKQDKEIYSRGW